MLHRGESLKMWEVTHTYGWVQICDYDGQTTDNISVGQTVFVSITIYLRTPASAARLMRCRI